MDLRAYYKRIREVETTLNAAFVVVVGLETPEGGRAGVGTEAVRFVAARLITEGRARLATPEEAKSFYESHAEARREAEASAAADRMQVTIVGHTDLKPRPSKVGKE